MSNTINQEKTTSSKTNSNDIKLAKILIKAKQAVYSDMAGNTITKLKGDGYDFSEIREYTPGDDIKKIAWNISAKTSKLYVKVFNPSKELNVNIIPLLPGSVFFGSKRLKQDLIAEIAAILAFSSCATSDPFSSYICANELKLCNPKTKKTKAIKPLVQDILNFNSINQQIDYKTLGSRIFSKLKSKSVLFLIGDFLFANKLDLRALSKKHDIILIQTRDKLEENIVNIPGVSLKDPISSMSSDGFFGSNSIKSYNQKLKKSDLEFELYLKKLGIRFVKIYTDDIVVSKLRSLFI